jgi:hypothetical protein
MVGKGVDNKNVTPQAQVKHKADKALKIPRFLKNKICTNYNIYIQYVYFCD